jgi:hypothetical protein
MLTVTDAHLAAGAGFVRCARREHATHAWPVEEPQAMVVDVDEGGQIIGLD